MKRSGFTLIELLVVILILGILAAFGIPQYLQSVENSKANDAASLVTMVGTTNRMYALDHSLNAGGYPKGTITTSCSSSCCPGAVGCATATTDPCALVACKYLATQDFDNKPYLMYADDGTGTKCTTLGFPAGNWVACATRQSCSGGGVAGVCATGSPYTGWGYAVDTNGKIGYANTCNTGSPACPTPVQ